MIDIAEVRRRRLALEWEQERRFCSDYSFFFRAAWHVIEPTTPLNYNWHIEVLCDELQRQAERIHERKPKEYDLIINIPPRSLKSSIVSKLLNPYVWSRFPDQKFLTASHDKDLALEHCVDSRDLIQSPWYQRHWGRVFELKADQNVKSFYKTDKGGYRMATSVGAGSIGKGAIWTVVDDPIDPKRAVSEKYREGCIRWYQKTFYSRLNNKSIGIRIIMMQRVHESDLCGFLQKYFPGDYKVFCIPGELTKDVSPKELAQYYDADGLFFPTEFSRIILDGYKKNLGPDYAGQILQSPSNPEGNLFKRHKFKFWQPAGMNLPAVEIRVGTDVYNLPVINLPNNFIDEIDSWDLALKEKKENDLCAGGHLAKTEKDFFLLDESSGHFSPAEKTQRVKELRKKFPNGSSILIEDTTGGAETIYWLKQEMPSVVGVAATANKIERATNAAAIVESGNYYVPHPAIAPWVWTYIDELCNFPRGEHDDRVDYTSQGINHLIRSRRIWPEYGGETTRFNLAFDTIEPESQLIVSQWMERNLRSSIIVSLWNPRTGKLWVWAEYFCESSSATMVVQAVRGVVKLITKNDRAENLSLYQWFGNTIMFSKAVGAVAESYDNAGVTVQKLDAYDEPGSIIRIWKLFDSKNLIVHPRAGLLREQMLSWSIDQNVKDQRPEEGYGFSRALCQTAAAIWDSGTIQSQLPPPRDYSVRRTTYLTEVNKLVNEGQFTAAVLKTNRRNKKSSRGTKAGWVI